MKSRITTTVGNIVKQDDCDAIVNSANGNLRTGSGVCGAIYSASGPLLEPCSIKLAPLELGDAVITPGFNLVNSWIIHVRGPKYHFDPDPPFYLTKAMKSVLVIAESHGIKKIAVPAISMGIYAYPPEEAVPILIDTITSLIPSLNSIQEIRFVVLQRKLADLFSACIA